MVNLCPIGFYLCDLSSESIPPNVRLPGAWGTRAPVASLKFQLLFPTQEGHAMDSTSKLFYELEVRGSLRILPFLRLTHSKTVTFSRASFVPPKFGPVKPHTSGALALFEAL